MENYCVGRTPGKDGKHEVHTCCCLRRPDLEDQILLGAFPDCTEALAEAEKRFGNQVESCPVCCVPGDDSAG
jgi:hypothetical protein